jgi:hypothetical protein
MKLKILTLTCALGLLALETGIKATDVVPEACQAKCDKTNKQTYGFVKCTACKLDAKAKATASGGLSGRNAPSSDTSSNTSSGTSSNTSSKTAGDACKTQPFCIKGDPAQSVFKCSKCKLEAKAKETASGGLSGRNAPSSGTSSKTSSNTSSKTSSEVSPGISSGNSDKGVSDLTTTMNTEGAPYLCSKGSFITHKVTLRSGKGVLCKNSVVAAFAKLHCVGKGDFDSSQCATQYMDAAIAKQGGKTPQEILNEAAEKGSGAMQAFAARFKRTDTNAD